MPLKRAVFTFTLLVGCQLFAQAAGQRKTSANILNAAFLGRDGVYNSELMAPYDVLQHSFYRDSLNYIRCFIVTPDGKPFVTFEGIRITPDYAFADAPAVDILIIPSTETSMTADLTYQPYIDWIRRTAQSARYVITVCDGAFPLAATGLLDGRTVTTFPGDRKRLAKMFPNTDVRFDVNFVQDGKFITSVGGALSYEPALFLVQQLYSPEHAKRTAKGLVLDWQLDAIPHLVTDSIIGNNDWRSLNPYLNHR